MFRLEKRECGVCGWEVKDAGSFSSLASSCCGALHHRDCLQVLASLGVRSCPSCHDSSTFYSEMLVNGLYFKDSFTFPQTLEADDVNLDKSNDTKFQSSEPSK